MTSLPKPTNRVARLSLATLCLLLNVDGTVDAEDRSGRLIKPTQAEVEIMARDIVYSVTEPPSQPLTHDERIATLEGRTTAANLGLEVVEGINDPATDLQALVLRHPASGQTYIVFRGTYSGMDLVDDGRTALPAQWGDVGYSQYEENRDKLAEWASKYPGSVVSGHSLGSSLGQRYIADHPHAVDEAVLFNAPGVDWATKTRFEENGGKDQHPPIHYFQGSHDLVSEMGGEVHLPGNVVIARGGRVDPRFAGSPGYRAPDEFGRNGRGVAPSPILAGHRGTMLQPTSLTTLTPVSFEDYERNRRRNLIPPHLRRLAPHILREIERGTDGRIPSTGAGPIEVTSDILSNLLGLGVGLIDEVAGRKPLSQDFWDNWNWQFGNHPSAEGHAGWTAGGLGNLIDGRFPWEEAVNEQDNPFKTPGWRRLSGRQPGSRPAETSPPTNAGQPSGGGMIRFSVPKNVPKW